jgi:1-acyl-sn-glycerol-3-phosphate acyltransferase
LSTLLAEGRIAMREPTLGERVHGSPELRRRQATARRLAAALARVEVVAADAVPVTGPVVLAVNHRSLLDGPLLFGFTPRPVSCLVKAEAFTPRMAPFLRSAGQIPLVRDAIDVAPVRLCLRIVRAGGVLGIFPEGTRGDGLARTAKPGVGYFALRSGAVVIPVACLGTYEMARRRGVRRPVARLTFGRPIRVERHPDDLPLNRRLVAATTESIRSALAALVAGAHEARTGEPEGMVA